MVGKYVDIGKYHLADSYISINQSLEHAGAHFRTKVEIDWIDSKRFEREPDSISELLSYDGIIIPGGFGRAGVEGKITAIRFARENDIPFLGLCYGMQLAVVEFARNVCGLEGANSTEIDSETKWPVVDFQPQQRKIIESSDYGGTMRLGAYSAIIDRESKVFRLYERSNRIKEDAERIERLKKMPDQAYRIGVIREGDTVILERHRHRYEVAPEFIDLLEDKGLVFSGYHETLDGIKLMEFLELPDHTFFVATQAHPEFKSRLEKPSPLFLGFVEAMLRKGRGANHDSG